MPHSTKSPELDRAANELNNEPAGSEERPQVAGSTQDNQEEAPASSPPKSWRFYLVFFSLCVLSFASALDGSIITTALPSVSHELGAAASENYVWMANSFTLAQTVIQPRLGQLCNILGRRIPLLASLVLFTLGSGIAGGATNVAMVIGGRTVQGLGSGGIYMLVDLVVCDLVSLRDRGKYLGIVLSTAAVGAILGPVVGGGLAQKSWRWVFYINVPIAGVVLVIMWFFLNVSYRKSPTRLIVKRIGFVLSFGLKQLELRQNVDEKGYGLQKMAQKVPKGAEKAPADEC